MSVEQFPNMNVGREGSGQSASRGRPECLVSLPRALLRRKMTEHRGWQIPSQSVETIPENINEK